jgi:hypothetical protein
MNLAGGFCWREWMIFSNCVPGLSFQVNGWGHVGFHCIQPNLQSTGLLRSLGYDTLENRNLAKIGYRFHIGVLRTPLWQGRYMWNLEAHPGLQTSCQTLEPKSTADHPRSGIPENLEPLWGRILIVNCWRRSISAKWKRGHFLHGEVFFLLTRPLMGDPHVFHIKN